MIYRMSAVVLRRSGWVFFFSGAATMCDPQRDCSLPHFNPQKIPAIMVMGKSQISKKKEIC